MADRIRETTKADQQREKLMALGKLSAGLAHELNNPASAVRNAAVNLQQAVRALRTAGLHLDKRPLAAEDRIFLARIECDWSKDHPPAALDSLERSDREEAVGDWLEQRRRSGRAAAGPGPGGCRLRSGYLASLSERFDDETLADAVTRLTASFTINRLVEQIESGTSRMTDLVRAIKQYTYMDQSSEQEIDVHEGLENTLIMLHYRLKYGIRVIREYDRSIPPICARGSELNQVWTNLIDNAIDAMNGQRRTGGANRARVRTAAGRDSRQRAGNSAGDSQPDLRTVLYDQAGGRRHGPGPRYRLPHCAKASGRGAGGFRAGQDFVSGTAAVRRSHVAAIP